MAQSTPKPIADDIPVDKAWQVGRRIYVRCAYESTLNQQLRAIGATWDRDVRALYVGTTKRDQILPLVTAQVQRIAAVTEVKAGGHWINIPYDAADIRAQAKTLGGVWDGQRKLWAMPTREALATVHNAVGEWTTARAAAQAAATRAAAEANAAISQRTAQTTEERLIAGSGRTLTDVRGTATGRLHGGKMYRDQAEKAKPQPGSVRRLHSGSRVLVLACTINFYSQDAIDEGFSPNLDDDPGWYYRYSYAVVEPTADEAAADAVEQAERDDEAEIAAVMRAADSITPKTEWRTQVDGASITQDAAGGLTVHGGKITVAADGTVWYQHPGWYDDYRAMEVTIIDETLVARVHAIIAAGVRRRGQHQVTP
jgi:hypothetical protein